MGRQYDKMHFQLFLTLYNEPFDIKSENETQNTKKVYFDFISQCTHTVSDHTILVHLKNVVYQFQIDTWVRLLNY